MSSKTREVYLSSKHKRRGDLGGVRYQKEGFKEVFVPLYMQLSIL